MRALLTWASGFAFTQLVEVPLYAPVTGSLRVAFLASALRHPVVWFVFPLLPVSYSTMVWLAEAFAVLVEAWWLKAHGVPRALWLSLVVNGLSASVGLALRATFGVP